MTHNYRLLHHAKRGDRCEICGKQTKVGDPIYWDGATHHVMHPKCFVKWVAAKEAAEPGKQALEVQDLNEGPSGGLEGKVADALKADDFPLKDIDRAFDTGTLKASMKKGEVKDRVDKLGKSLADDVARAMDRGAPIDILGWKRALDRMGVPTAIKLLPDLKGDEEEDIDDIAGWGEVKVEDLYLEGRELLLTLSGGAALDRLQDIFESLVRKAVGDD